MIFLLEDFLVKLIIYLIIFKKLLQTGAAVDQNGVVWTWGSNNNGELGVGDYKPRLNPFPVAALKGRKVIKVVCGTNYMLALSAPKNKEFKSKHSISIHNTSLNYIGI